MNARALDAVAQALSDGFSRHVISTVVELDVGGKKQVLKAFSLVVSVGNRWTVVLPRILHAEVRGALEAGGKLNQCLFRGLRTDVSDVRLRLPFKWDMTRFFPSLGLCLLSPNDKQISALTSAGKLPLSAESWVPQLPDGHELFVAGIRTTDSIDAEDELVIQHVPHPASPIRPGLLGQFEIEATKLAFDFTPGAVIVASDSLAIYGLLGWWIRSTPAANCFLLFIRAARQIQSRPARKFERGICHWCGQIKDLTDDHVPPKNAFPKRVHHLLKIVRACKDCNEDWSLAADYFREWLVFFCLTDVKNKDVEELQDGVRKAMRTRARADKEPLLIVRRPASREEWEKMKQWFVPDGQKLSDVIARIMQVMFSEEFGYYLLRQDAGFNCACIRPEDTGHAAAQDLLKREGKLLAAGRFKYLIRKLGDEAVPHYEFLMSFYEHAVFAGTITADAHLRLEFTLLGLKFSPGSRETEFMCASAVEAL